MPPLSPLDVPEGDPFGPHNLPYGVFTTAGAPDRRRRRPLGDHVLDAGAAARGRSARPHAALLGRRLLNPLLAAGRTAWSDVRRALTRVADRPGAPAASSRSCTRCRRSTLHLPFEVADYVDFYASEHHATNVGQIFRPDGDAADPQLEAPADRLPRPRGHGRRLRHGRRTPLAASARRPPTPPPSSGRRVRLDIEAEVGFVVGAPSELGTPVPLADFREHVFGLCLLNDWSARDIQAWEYVPLGPFLGKSFATSVSAWITPLDALDAARIAPPARDVPLLPYLDDARRGRSPAARPADRRRASTATSSPSRPSPPCTGRPPSSSPT